MRTLCALIIILFFCTTNISAQSLTAKEIEDDLIHEYSRLVNFDENRNYDSVDHQLSVFRNKFAGYINKYPFALTYPFQKLKDSCNINIVTSNDNLFRIYSWDTWTGGTERSFDNIFQFKSDKKVYSKALFDTSNDDNPSFFYSDIYSLQANGKVYYLTVNNAIYSSKDVSESIEVFCVENDKLSNVNLIKTSTGFHNQINVDFNFFSVADRPERPVRVIKYDSTTKIIYIPVVLDEGQVSKKFIRYQFNGKYFQKILN